MMATLIERLRRRKKVLQQNTWVDSDEPLNIDGPEAADTIEKLQNDFIALLALMKDEARQRGIAEGKLAAYMDKVEFQLRRLEAKIDGHFGAKITREKIVAKVEKSKPIYSKSDTPSSNQKFIEKGIPTVKASTPIADINFPARIENVMRNISAETVGDVLLLTEVDLLSNPNFGRKSLNLLKQVLTANGYELSKTTNVGPRIKRAKSGMFLCFMKEASVAP